MTIYVKVSIYISIYQSIYLSRLQSGWSAKTATLNHWKQPDPLSNNEQV